MDNIIGKKIEGRYEITELIGVGGMANVYRAVDMTDNKTVAIKILKEEFYKNEEFLRRFKNESKAIAMLSHNNIVQVYDVCFSKGMQMIVMEHLDGITLKEYVQQQGALTWKETVHFTRQILQALSHAHLRGVVHRDMKPQNVMLLSDGTLKLADFGIARFARSEANTITDRAIGSVHYISPEQARGETIDQRTDIYSVGVMMFEMLTGELPFDADSPVSVALKQIQLEAPSIQSLNPEIPDALDTITARAMEKDPDIRYQTAQDMLYAIEEFKKNPSSSFEYQYLSDQQSEGAKYQRKVKKIKDANSQKNKETSNAKEREKMKKNTTPKKETKEEDSKSPMLMILAGITGAFVVISATFIFAMLYLNNPLEKVPDTKVPNLIGLSYDEVKNAPEYQNIEILVEETKFSSLHESGDIIEQTPKAEKTVKIGSLVKVIISSGEDIINVPNLVGYEETIAYQELANIGFEYQKVAIYDALPLGTVINTEPGPNSQVAVGSTIQLMVSMGPESTVVEVPNLLGLSLDQAKAALDALGLIPGGISFVPSDEPYEEVVAQEPSSTSQVSVGSFIDINVSAGESSAGRVELSIHLPTNNTETVKMTVRQGDVLVKEEMLIPSVAEVWRPVFESTGSKATLSVFLDNIDYMVFDVDFTDGTFQIKEDNSASHN